MSSTNAYVEAFLTKKPKEGISVVETRLKDAMALDMEIAEYFKERSQIEEAYAKSLAKASRRLYIMDPGVLGHFAPVWELLLQELSQVAGYHSDLAHKVSQNIEKPLRATPSEDYHRLQQLQPLIQSIESKKPNKFASVKGSIFKKSRNSFSGTSSWQNEGVEYLNLHEKIDQARLTRLKTLVEDFERIQSEQLMKRVEMANITLSAAEVFDIQHDINDFCKERGKGLTTLEHHDTGSADKDETSTMRSHDSHRSTNKFKSVFTKKKKTDNHIQHGGYSEEYVESFAPEHGDSPASTASISTPTTNSAPLVDTEGFSIIPQSNTTNSFPTVASDISSRNTLDDVDSDLQSLKLNQRLQINIQNDAVHEESKHTSESFYKMASMLRERAPTTTRRARGRRDLVNRSQTESMLFFSTPSYGLDNSRANSMISPSSSDISNANPFQTSHVLPQPSQTNTGMALTDPPTNWLQPIPEVNHSQYLSVSIVEEITLTSPDSLLISGQIMVSYHGPASAFSVPLQLHHIDDMQQFSPNTRYISQQEDGGYVLNTRTLENDPVPCFAYRVNSSALALPVRLSPCWKCVDGQSYLIIKHDKHAVMDIRKLNGSVQVDLPDQQVTNVQSTPQAVWDVAKHRLCWKLQDLFEQYNSETEENSQQRLLAKFYVNGHGSPHPVQLNYQWHDSLASGLSISCSSVEIKHMETMVRSHQIVYM